MTAGRPGGGSRRGRAALAALTAGLALAGCGTQVTSFDFPLPPSTSSGATTTVPTVPDDARITEPTVPSSPTTATIAIGPGAATVSGSVEGPDGTVAGATVLLQRLVGDQVASTTLVTSTAGAFVAGHILGGRYRVRAWLAPSLAMTQPDIFFLPGTATRRLVLRVGHHGGPTVTFAFAPDPPTEGRPTEVVLDVTTATVSAAGFVSYAPDSGTSVQLIGDWTFRGAVSRTVGPSGQVAFQGTCDAAGADPLVALVGSLASVAVRTPRCLPAPRPPPPSTAPPPTSPPTGASGSSPPTGASGSSGTTGTTAPGGSAPGSGTTGPAAG